MGCVNQEDVVREIENIKNSSFEFKEKIIDILFEKRDLTNYAEEYGKVAGLSENDMKGYLALCE